MISNLIGVVSSSQNYSNLITKPLNTSVNFEAVVAQNSRDLIASLMGRKIDGLIFCVEMFTIKHLMNVKKIRSYVKDIPIIIASEGVEKIVKDNLNYFGRIGHVDLETQSHLVAKLYSALKKKEDIIERSHLRYEQHTPTQIQICGEQIRAHILDLSVGGSKVHIPIGGVRKGEHMTIFIPAQKRQMTVEGEVMWVEDVEDALGNDQKVGLRFIRMINTGGK